MPLSSPQPLGISQIPANPCFRNAAVNSVAVVPLLSSHDDIKSDAQETTTRSTKSFADLLEALRRHSSKSTGNTSKSAENSASSQSTELLLVVPNSVLTRPGDWRYQDTPLKAFHWQHGCQRLQIHDGRPGYSRRAHDRLLATSAVTRDWIDLCPSRRTAAVIGVLNMHDCQGAADVSRACEELQQWAARYSTPSYAVTAHGHGGGGECVRDTPVTRLFVYDSFDDESQALDLTAQTVIPGTSILAFPPTDKAHLQMMDLHLNLVVSDLTVAIFRDLEHKIQESLCLVDSEYSLQQQAELLQQQQQQGGLARRSLARFVTGSSTNSGGDATTPSTEEPTRPGRTLGISQLAGLVNPESKLAKDSPTAARGGSNTSPFPDAAAVHTSTPIASAKLASKLPPLMTPLDDEGISLSMDGTQPKVMGAKDAEAMRKRETGRREKFLADLCLLAGSPLDAYEHYLKAAELCKTVAMDPLWHASALEGCAAAHIAMAEAGGYR
jgi:Transport protein Trs120 or TRAPPC9, TRAPP II complex subunit